MIPAQSAQEAITLAAQLEAANRSLVCAGDTPLSKLMEVCCVNFAPNASAIIVADSVVNEYLPDAKAIEAESRYPSVEHENMSQHDAIMDDIITEAATQVGAHLNFAKNTVRPLIKEYVDTVCAQLAAYPDQGSYTPTIVRVDLPEVALMAQIEREADKFKDGVYRPLTTALRLPSLSAAEAVALMTTGAAAMDAAIALWVAARDEGFFLNAYNVAFCSTQEGVTDSPESLLTNKVDGGQNLTAMFLMARRLLETPPEESGYSLTEYRVAVGEMVEQLGLRLVNAYADRARNISQQNLVLSSDKDTAWVLKPIYDQWIEEGNNPAILFGNLLMDRPNISVPAIAVDATKCLELWERQNRFLTLTLQNRKADAAKETLRFCATKLMAENLDECFGECTNEQTLAFASPTVTNARDEVFKYIDSLDNESLKDLWQIGTCVVAGKIFAYSAAYDILKGLEQATRDNPGIEPAEAALLSTISYVTNYVVDQIELRDL